jgi:hypothetical protein
MGKGAGSWLILCGKLCRSHNEHAGCLWHSRWEGKRPGCCGAQVQMGKLDSRAVAIKVLRVEHCTEDDSNFATQ